MKYVYLILSLENSYYKIGISKHPQKRINELQTGNSSKLKLIDIYQSEYASQIERTLHCRYSHLKKEGEWFNLSLNEELLFKNECKNIENNFKFLKKSGNVFL